MIPVRKHLSLRRRLRVTRNALGYAEPVWLFDLDNTIHDASHAIFPRINVSMTQAVINALDVSEAEANVVRQRYWKRFGATLIGMVKYHGTSAKTFLQDSHDFDVQPLLKADKGLDQLFKKLPGRKVLLTNAPISYACAVLSTLGILQHFDSLWGVEEMNLHGQFKVKPSEHLMRYVLAREGVKAEQVILVEDTLRNLKVAKKLGMRTIHIRHPDTPFSSPQRGRPLYVDLKVNGVRDVLLGRRGMR